MATRNRPRLLKAITLLFLLSMVVPLIPAATAQDAAPGTPAAVAGAIEPPAEAPAEPIVAEPTLAPVEPPVDLPAPTEATIPPTEPETVPTEAPIVVPTEDLVVPTEPASQPTALPTDEPVTPTEDAGPDDVSEDLSGSTPTAATNRTMTALDDGSETHAVEGIVTLHVIDEVTETPIEGGRVEIDPIPGGTGRAAEGTTDASGTFVTSSSLPAGEYLVSVFHSDYQGGFGNGGTIQVSGPTEVTIPLKPFETGIVTLTVVGPDGTTPVPGAAVVIGDRATTTEQVASGTTDASGQFVTSRGIRNGEYPVSIRIDGYAPKIDTIYVQGETAITIRLDVRLDENGIIRVVEQHTGAPIAGASVELRQRGGGDQYSGTTDASGVFRLFDPPAEDDYVLMATKDGYKSVWNVIRVSGATDITIQMVPLAAGIVTVKVEDFGMSEPIPYAIVTIRNPDTGQIVAGGTADALGIFQTNEALQPGWYDFEASADGFMPWSETELVDGPTRVGLWLSRDPEPYRSILNVVDDRTGDPIEGAEVVIRISSQSDGSVASGITDASGQFTFDTLYGTYDVRVTKPGYENRLASIEIIGQIEYTIRLLPLGADTGTLTIWVRDEMLPEPIGGASISVVNANQVTVASGTTGTTGALVIDRPLLVGNYNVQIDKDDYIGASVTATVTADSLTEITVSLRLSSAGELTVRVVDEKANEPVPGASVHIYDVDRDLVSNGITDASGSFATGRPLFEGTYDIEIEGDGYLSGQASVHLSGPTDVQIQIKPTTEPTETATSVPTTTPTVTPAKTVTPEPSETPTVAVTPMPSETVEPTETATAVPTEEADEGQIETTFALCADTACTPPYNTDADGFIVSWTVTESGDDLIRRIPVDSFALASVDPGAGLVGIRAFQTADPASFTITAVLQGGVATGLSTPLPFGTYAVCLNPLLVGPDGSTIRIADEALCETLALTGDGAGNEGETAFSAMIAEDPPAMPENPAQEPDPAGNPVTGDPADGLEAETPANESTANLPAVGIATGGASLPGETAVAVGGGTTTTVAGLPVTGAGASTSTVTIWLLALGSLVFIGAGVGIRRHARG